MFKFGNSRSQRLFFSHSLFPIKRSIPREFSLVDVAQALTGHSKKYASQIIIRIQKEHPAVSAKCGHCKFTGKGQKDTPVGDISNKLFFFCEGNAMSDATPIDTIVIPSFDTTNIRIKRSVPREFSLVDVAQALTGKQSHYAQEIIRRIRKSNPEVDAKCGHLKFAGKGQKDTPVGDIVLVLEIIGLLPGSNAAIFRRKMAEVMRTFLAGNQEELNYYMQKFNEVEGNEILDAARESARISPPIVNTRKRPCIVSAETQAKYLLCNHKANDTIKVFIDKHPFLEPYKSQIYMVKEKELTKACTGMYPWQYKLEKCKKSGSARDAFDEKLKLLATLGDIMIVENLEAVNTFEQYSKGVGEACSRVKTMREAMTRTNPLYLQPKFK